MKSVKVDQAVGLTLGHDITEIVPGRHKKTAFKRGQIIRPEDVEHLRRLGKEHIFVWAEDPAGLLHEDEAARRLAQAMAGAGVNFGEPSEGRIDLRAAHNGLLEMDLDLLEALNDISQVTVATIIRLREVKAGQILAGTRVIPLMVAEEAVLAAEALCAARGPLLSVSPFRQLKVGVVTTGSEVSRGLIEDGFTPVLRQKFGAWGSELGFHQVVSDETAVVAAAIREALACGCQMVCVTGGMSVDPDDKSPAAISEVCGQLITYGAPVFPGAMFMLGYRGDIPILGLPGCVMYRRASLFDLIVPRLLAGHRLTRRDFTRLAHGGLCLSCDSCRFPDCSFGV